MSFLKSSPLLFFLASRHNTEQTPPEYLRQWCESPYLQGLLDPEQIFSICPSKMASAVLEEAKRISAGFEYSTEELNKGVEEFLREMEVGLSREDSGLSQIPSYITSVPDGTEKVQYLSFA